jgi:DMSO/TMAO reductase YedYZ molybdopterin-dependent catalytic subunit
MKESKKLSRRTFLAKAGGSVVSIGLPGIFVKLMDLENLALAAERRPDGRPRLPPSQQAVKKIIDMGGVQGTVDSKNWRLQIHGEVGRPTTVYPRWTLPAMCIVSPVGPCLILSGVVFV